MAYSLSFYKPVAVFKSREPGLISLSTASCVCVCSGASCHILKEEGLITLQYNELYFMFI